MRTMNFTPNQIPVRPATLPKVRGGLTFFTLFVLLAFLSARTAYSQASGYSFATSTSTYTAITGGTVINTTITDDDTYGPFTLTPGFNFAGVTYTTAYVTTNGLVSLGAGSPSNSEYSALSNTTGSGITICPFNADLNASTATGVAPEMRFQTVGNEHVFQWTDAQRFNLTDRISFQARLNTSTGVVKFVYGGGTIVAGTSLIRQPFVGIRTSTTDFKNITVGTGTETWAAPLPGVNNTDAMRFTSASPAKLPVDGQTYTFTPPTCFSPSALNVTAITINSATINWTAASPVPGIGYDVYYSTSSTAPTSTTTPTASTTALTLPISGLSFNTVYYVWVRSSCSVADKSNWIALPSFTTLIACNAPTAVSVGPITATSAYVSFTGPGPSYIVEYGAVGFTPGVGAAAGTGGTIVTGTSAPILLSGLTANTTYDLYVRTNCSAASFGYSTNSTKTTFNTNNCTPQTITGTTPGVRCGTGTVNLAATASGGTIKWYSSLIGGNVLGTGSPFTTPTINTTTTYYAAADVSTSSNVQIGTATTLTGATSQPTAFMNRFTQYWCQMVFTATELNSAGLGAGNITAITYNIGALGSAANVTNFTVMLGPTTNSTLSTFTTTGLNTVYGPSTYTSAVGANTITFTTPYYWDGVSNIIVDLRQNGIDASNNATTAYTATTGNTAVWAVTSSASPSIYVASTSATTSVNRLNTTFAGQSVCVGPRSPVTATVNTAPAFTITGDQTVCNNAITTLSVTTPLANYNTYSWTPITNLYTDAAATIPYVAGANASTIYFKSSIAGPVTYTAAANNTTSLCASVATINLTVLPGSVVATATPGSICGSGATTLTLTPATGYGAGTFQWQSSANNTTFTDISSATSATYTTPILTTTTYYRAVIKNSSGATCLSSVSDTAAVFNPTITGTTPGSRCGAGPVVLSATTSEGTVKWYTAPTGGSSVATGSPFTTPSISATTNYYVSAANGGGSGVAINGLGALVSNTSGTFEGTSPYAYHWGNYKHQMLVKASDLITAGASAGNLTSLSFDVASVGVASFLNFNISLKMTTATALTSTFETPVTGVYSAASVTPAVGINTYTFATPFPWDGVSNIIVQVCWNNTNTGSVANSAEVKYDLTSYVSHNIFRADNSQPNVCAEPSGNASNDGPLISKLPKMLFGYNSGCESGRTLVVATINPKPDTTVTVSGPLTFCPNKNVTFTAATGLTYQWLLNNNIIAGATSATYTTNATGSYRVKVSNATCTDTSNARVVTILPGPIATVTAGGPTTFCAGDSVRLRGPLFTTGMIYQWQLNSANITGATDTTYKVIASGNYRLVMTNGTCSDTSAAITVTVNPVPVVDVSPTTAAVCSGTSITLTASGASTYSWSPATGLNTTAGATVIATPATTTTYTVTGVGTNGCSATFTKTVTVSPAPSVSITPSSATSICVGDSVLLTAGGALTYSWSPATGLTTTTGTSVWAHPTTTTTYTVIGDDGIGCTASATKVVTVNTLPTIGVTPATATTVCAGVSTTLTANGGVSYSWSPATGLNTTTGATVIATPATTTTYTVTGTNASGCSSTATKLITVNAVPSLAITPVTAAICAGSSIPLSASGASTYSWSPTTNLTPTTGANVTASPTTTTTYTVTGTGTNGCTATLARTVTVTAIPTPNITPAVAPSVCAGSSVTLTANGGTTYSWSPATGLSSTNTATTIATPTTTTTYTVTATTNGCSGIATKTVTVNPLPTATITAAGTTSFCTGGSVVLNANTGTGLAYTWRTNGAPNGVTTASYTATASGTYDVIVSNGTCTNTSNAILVNASAAPVTTVTPAGSTTFCQGGSVVLNAVLNAGYTYQWQLGGSPITGANAASYTATTTGNYSVVIINGTCTGTSGITPVTVNSNPPAAVLPQGATTFCEGGAVTLFASIGTGYTYQWQLNGGAIPGANNATYVATASGDYGVTVTNGLTTCTSQATPVTVQVVAATTPVITVNGAVLSTGNYAAYQWYRNGVAIPGANSKDYTVTQDGSYTVEVTILTGCTRISQPVTISNLSVGGVGTTSVTFYPNPAATMITIVADKTVNISLSSLDGKEVLRQTEAKTVDIHSLADGVYMLRITDKSGQLLKIDRLIKTTR